MISKKPTNSSNKYHGRVMNNEEICQNVYHLKIDTILPKHEAGQFFMVSVSKNNIIYTKPYSIASSENDKEVSLIIKAANPGNVSKVLTQSKEGTAIELKGPYGRFVIEDKDSNQLFIATGAGYAPFRSMLRNLFEKYYTGKGNNTKQEITLLFGTRTKEEIIELKELQKLAKENNNFKYIVALTQEKENDEFLKGRLSEHLNKVITKNQKIMICGSKEMTTNVKNKLIEKNIRCENIHIEIY